MKKKIRIVILVACILGISIPQLSPAQHWGGKRKPSILDNWSVNANAGLTSFFGDLSAYDNEISSKLTQESGPAAGFIISKLFKDRFSISGQFLYGNLKGTNNGHESFEASFYEYNLQARVYLIKLFDPYSYSNFDINLFGGIGQFKFKTTKYDYSDIIPETTVKEDNKPEFVYLLGLGTSYRFIEQWGATFEVALRQAQNDYLDYTKKNGDDDFYSYLSFGITYYIDSFQKTRYKSRYYKSRNTGRLPMRRRR